MVESQREKSKIAVSGEPAWRQEGPTKVMG